MQLASSQRDLPLHPGQRRTDAVVDAASERDVPVLPPEHVDPMRVGETSLVAICTEQSDQRQFCSGNIAVSQIDRFRCEKESGGCWKFRSRGPTTGWFNSISPRACPLTSFR